jgi:hypothetical protein
MGDTIWATASSTRPLFPLSPRSEHGRKHENTYCNLQVFYLDVASCKCFIWMLHMFHTHVSSVYSKCFICFRRMLHPSVSYFRHRESWGMDRASGDGAQRAEASGWGVLGASGRDVRRT